ncbi:TPA: hypothetical protein EYP26_05105 [Candidatus Bathyarchaeota archaeon]|nr:hypothetical protein [Candidatus Bathyarchaeota archaeon]
MKKCLLRATLLTSITLLLLASLTPPAAPAAQPRYAIKKITRIIYISDWGLAAVNDTVLVRNEGTEALASVDLGFPSLYAESLKYYVAKAEGAELTVTTSLDKEKAIHWLSYYFPAPLEPGGEYNFSSLTVFSDLVSYKEGKYNFSFAEAPVLKERANLCNVTIVLTADASPSLPENSTFKEVKFGKMPAVNKVFEPLEPYHTEIFSLEFSSVSLQLLKVHRAERTISLDSPGKIKVLDGFSIHNPGVLIAAVKVRLPKGAARVMAYDPAGPLWEEERAGEEVTVAPRFGDIRHGENFTFYLKYELKQESYVERADWRGVYLLKFNFSSRQPWLLDKLVVRIVLPSGGEIEKISVEPANVTETSYQKVLLYEFDGITPIHDTSFTIKYRYGGFWASLRPLEWVVIIEAIVCAFAVVARRKLAIPAAPAPRDAVSKFVELYDEKIAHERELEEIETPALRRALPKKEYKRRKRLAESRLSEISKALGEVKEELRRAGRRYDELIKEIERAEAEIGAARASEAQVSLQYRSGKITKEAYESVVKEIRKRVDKAKAAMERALITLREEI